MSASNQFHTAAASPWTSEDAWIGSRRPILEAHALPAAVYANQDFYDLESERVFGTSWVCIGVADEMRPEGQVMVRDIAGLSIIVTMDTQGGLRGFANSCRHRGTRLIESDCTIGRTIRCPYHRWGYDRDGNLISTPQFADAGVDGFDPADFGLHPVRVEQWECLLFATLDHDAPSVDEWFGDLGRRLSGYRLESWRTHDSTMLDIRANWKLITENFQEYYHLPWIHPELAKVSRVVDHYRYQGYGMYCGQTTTPITNDERGDWAAMPPAEGLDHSDMASGRFIALFPNVMLSVLPNHVFVIRLEPLGPGITREHCTWLLPPGSEDVTGEDFAVTHDFWIHVNGEDVGIVERNQRGLGTGGYTPGRLSPRFEEPLHRFHNMLADRMTGLSRIPDGDPSDDLPLYGTGVNPLPWRDTHGRPTREVAAHERHA